jgi:peptidoglycan/LPS O-acetylase OafA/YrhL
LGFLVIAILDAIATVQRPARPTPVLQRSYDLESYDFLWTLGMVAIAYAAWAPLPNRLLSERPTGWQAIALLLTVQALAIATHVFGFFHEIPPGGRPITLAVLLLGMVQIYVPRARRRGRGGEARHGGEASGAGRADRSDRTDDRRRTPAVL